MNNSFKNIRKTLKKSRTAVIISHIDPDYDSIGSTIALARLLRALKIRSVMYCESPVPSAYSFIPHIKNVVNNVPRNKKFDLAITVDSADLKRTGTKFDLKRSAKKVINIDHHPDNTMFGDINHVRKVSSVAELIYGLSKYLKIRITKDVAICLYTAMVTDTGSFRYENTTPDTFRMAADLVCLGADPDWISTKIYDTKSKEALKALAEALSNFKTLKSGKVVWATLSKRSIDRMKAKGEDFTGIIDMLRSLETAEVALLFREESAGCIKVNFRSKKYVNVQKIAGMFGGGGHIRAAGAVIEGNLSKIQNKVLKAVSRAV